MKGKNKKTCVYIVLVKCISQAQSHLPLVLTVDSAVMVLGNVQYDQSVSPGGSLSSTGSGIKLT